MYLGVSWARDDEYQLYLGPDPQSCLALPSGRVSPLFSLCGQEPTLSAEGVLLFLFPKNPRDTLSQIKSDEEPDIVRSTYITHGLAAVVVFLDSQAKAEALQDRFIASLNGAEAWTYSGGMVKLQGIRIRRPADNSTPRPILCQIEIDRLPDHIAKEVTQFNLNVDVLAATVQNFAPEFTDLVTWLIESASKRIDEIRHRYQQDLDYHRDAAILVDLNSCLTMVISQLCSGASPLLHACYPVGQYSFLGIGTATRSAWSLYQHMARVFARVDHVSQLSGSLERGPAFDPGFDSTNKTIDTESWQRASRSLSLDNAVTESPNPGRGHLIYFSSRWGFHETLNSITLSWQTISSGALPEWTLLTLSHEFLHSYFRETVHSILFTPESYGSLDELVAKYNDARQRHSGNPGAWAGLRLSSADCMRFFILSQLQICSQLDKWVSSALSDHVPFCAEISAITPGEAESLMQAYMPGDLEEYMVHILDYQYFYDTNDRYYISSIWNTWSLVPDVYRRVEHYVLRTLLALASSHAEPSAPSVFISVHSKLRSELEKLVSTRNNSLAKAAIDLLLDEYGCMSLWLRFNALHNLVLFTRTFFVDTKMYARLMSDSSQDRAADSRYGLAVGDYHEPIQSPVAFLLERFATSLDDDISDSEYVSLWQFILLITQSTT